MPMSAATTRPARTPGVCAALTTSRIAPIRRSVRQASPNSNLRLKSMLLHAPVKGAALEAEFGGSQRHVEMMHSKRALDHLLFELVEVEIVADHRQRMKASERCGKREIVEPIGSPSAMITARSAAWRSARTLPGQSWRTSASNTCRRKCPLRPVIFARVEAEIMVEQNRDVVAPFAERRQLDLDRVEAEQQVLPEALFVGQLVGRHVGRGDNPDVDRDRLVGADRDTSRCSSAVRSLGCR